MLAGPEVMLVATLDFFINSVASWVVIKLIKLREEVLNSLCSYLGERLLILVSSKSYWFSQNMEELGLLEFSMLLPVRLDLDSDFKSCLEGKMNCRKAEVCTDLWIHLVQSSLSRDTHSSLLRPAFRCHLKISREKDEYTLRKTACSKKSQFDWQIG